MSSIVSRELDYAEIPVSHGTYMYTQLTPINGQNNTVTVSTAGGQESIFEIPQQVINFGRSELRFSQSCPALAGKSTNAFLDGAPQIRQLQVYNRNRVMLVDLNDVNKYMNMITRYENKFEDVQTNDCASTANVFDSAAGVVQPFMPNRAATQSNQRVFNNAMGAAGAVRKPYSEGSYVLAGTAQNAINYTNWEIPLSYIKGTILSLDKDFLFDTSIYVRIVWAPSTMIYFTSTNVADIFTGAAAAVGNVSISSLYLYVAQEQNPVIIQSLKDKIASGGLKFNIPFLYQYKTNLPSNSYSDIQLRLNSGHGKKLMKFYWSVYNPVESSLTTYDHNNLEDGGDCNKVREFWVTLNNIRLHQYNLTCLTHDDYSIQKDQMRGSAILSNDEYMYNFVFQHKFTDNQPPMNYPLTPDASQHDDGIMLDQEQIIDIRANTNNDGGGSATFNHYVFSVCQRELLVTPAMTEVK